MEKRISQETFDGVVAENVQDFEMPLNEAIEDAIKQFLSQGVNLDNIDTSGGVGREELDAAINIVNNYAADNSAASTEDVIRNIDILSRLCDSKEEFSTRNIGIVVSSGCFNSLHSLMSSEQPVNILTDVLTILALLCKINVGCRDFFEPGGSTKLSAVVKVFVRPFLESDSSSFLALRNSLNLCKIVSKSENNKVALMKTGLADDLVQIISVGLTDQSRFPILKEACNVIRGLCIHDDTRKETSCAYDNGRYLVGSTQAPASLIRIANQYQESSSLATAAIMATRSLVNADDAVRVIAQCGVLQLPAAILRDWQESPALVKAILGLTRNLCADDARKDILVGDGTMNLILRTICHETLSQDPVLVEHGIACLAAMSLRSPYNSNKMMAAGVAPIISKAMNSHKNAPPLLRQACLLIRNIAARCPDQRDNLRDASLEERLREAGSRFREVVDEAYGALRDLGCEAQVVQVSESGSVQQAYEQFGNGRKAQFNPVFEETSELQSRVSSAATAPFAVSRQSQRIEDDDDDNADIAAKVSGSSHVFTNVTSATTHPGDCGCDEH